MNDLEKAIHEKFQKELPNQLINWLTSDLYYGPHAIGDTDDNEYFYVGFSKGLDDLKDAIDDLELSTMYFDNGCDFLTTIEPEPWLDDETNEYIEPFWEEIYQVEPKEIVSILIGKELATYI